MKTYKSFIDFGEALKKLISETEFNYRGNLIKHSIDGYKMSGRHYRTLEEIDVELDKQYDSWNENIKKQNNGK